MYLLIGFVELLVSISFKTIVPNLTAGNAVESLGMRGKPWSKNEEKLLRQLVEEGKSFDEISIIMGKSRLSVKGKLFNSGLNSVKVATGVQRAIATTIATTTSPAEGTAGSLAAPMPGAVVGAAEDKFADVVSKLPDRLPSVEEELKVLVAAVEAFRQPGLSRAEGSRLHNIIVGVKVYQELFAKFVDYCGLEAEVLELRRQLASKNARSSSDTSS